MTVNIVRSHTPGPWKVISLGGCSTVISSTCPPRSDTRIPAYGYDKSKGHCIAYPFIEDNSGLRTRLDFVCFSHDDARLIAAAPELLEALRHCATDEGPEQEWLDRARAAIAKAEGV